MPTLIETWIERIEQAKQARHVEWQLGYEFGWVLGYPGQFHSQPQTASSRLIRNYQNGQTLSELASEPPFLTE